MGLMVFVCICIGSHGEVIKVVRQLGYVWQDLNKSLNW